MALLRDAGDDFASAIDNAAQTLGLAPTFVEKDYWVTQVLRELHVRYPGGFVFKGGTSLSKGYGLIDRFSEDVDILVLPAKDDSARAREKLLASISIDVAEALNMDLTEKRPPGRGRAAHRADVLAHPKVTSSAIATPFENRGVLLETGFAGGDWPSEMVTLEPMLCGPLGLDPAEYDDTERFVVRALRPERTLLEKLSLLHHVASEFDAKTSDDARCGRHYYDVYRLLDHGPTRSALGDRAQFHITLSHMETVSKHYGGWTARPEDGYASSPAFSPPDGSDLRAWLAQLYTDAAGLLPAKTTGAWPTFGRVLGRIGEHAKLL